MERDIRKYIKATEYAKLTGLNYRTIVRNFKEGKISGYSSKGRFYLKNPNYYGLINNSDSDLKSSENKVILYGRVSRRKDKKKLSEQMDTLRQYAYSKNYAIVAEYSEIAPAIESKQKKLNELLDRKDYSILLIEYKNRLTPLNFNLMESLLNRTGIRIEVMNNSSDDFQELISNEDFEYIMKTFESKKYKKEKCLDFISKRKKKNKNNKKQKDNNETIKNKLDI
mgnify:FL=1